MERLTNGHILYLQVCVFDRNQTSSAWEFHLPVAVVG